MRLLSRRAWLLSATSLLLVAAGCSGGGEGTSPADPAAVRVASFDFPESEVLAEIYAGALERVGIPVVRRTGLAAREEVEPALEQGLVDVVPEYTGTALTFLDRGGQRASADADLTYRLLRDAFASRGIVTLAPAPAQTQNAVAVTRATAERLRLAAVSDLAPVAPELVFGGPPECPQRRLCLPGLEAVYGLRFQAFQSLDAAGPLTVGALQGGEIDVGLLFTTTPGLDAAGIVLLDDDRSLQPAEHVVPVVRAAVARRYGNRLAAALDSVSAGLTTDDLRRLDEQVGTEGRRPAAVARQWLDERDQGP